MPRPTTYSRALVAIKTNELLMRYILTIILIFTFRLFTYGQSKVTFDIQENLIMDSTKRLEFKDFNKRDTAFFQDENYYVRRTCSGEWGGSIWFKNKSTGIEYSCSATCPVIINKIGDKYVLTNSLAHMCGSAEVVEIENPDSMDIFKKPEPRDKKKRGKVRSYYYGDFESKSKKGTNLIVDTICTMIYMSFPFDGQLYHVVSDSKTLYLSQISENKLVTVDTIYSGLDNFYKRGEGILYTYSTEGFKTKDNHYIVMFENSGLVGFLDIFENKIRLTRYQ